MKNLIWCEKYRPQRIEDMVLSRDLRLLVENFVNHKSIPHLLLIGDAGCGKTTLARILIDELNASSMELNASDERGIDTVRTKIKRFVSLDAGDQLKIVMLDEADGISADGQQCLRNMMETFAEKSRFILTANIEKKIIRPIQSRCQCVSFERLPVKEQLKLVIEILVKENIRYNEEDILKYIEECNDDMRMLINELQKNSITGELSFNEVRKVEDIEKIFDLVKSGSWLDLKQLIVSYIDMTSIYSYLYDYAFKSMNWEEMVKIVAHYAFQNGFVYRKDINLMACLIELKTYLI